MSKDLRRVKAMPSRHRHALRVFTLMACATLVALFSACSEEPKEPLRVGLVVWPPFEMAYLAQDLGYYDDAGIRLIDYGSPAEFVQAYKSGSVDAVATVFDYALQLQQDDPQQKIVLAIDVSLGGDALVAKPGIRSLEELKGKSVGYEASALGAYMLTRALSSAGLAQDDIVPVSVDTIDHEQAFRDGQIDAVVTYEPTVTLLVAEGAHVLFDSAQIPGEIVDVLLTSAGALENKREQLQRFVDGWFSAVRYQQANPEDAAKRVSTREQLTPEQYLASFEKVKLMGLEENKKYLVGSGAPVLQALQRHKAVMIREGFLHSSPDTSTMIDDSLISRAPDG